MLKCFFSQTVAMLIIHSYLYITEIYLFIITDLFFVIKELRNVVQYIYLIRK